MNDLMDISAFKQLDVVLLSKIEKQTVKKESYKQI